MTARFNSISRMLGAILALVMLVSLCTFSVSAGDDTLYIGVDDIIENPDGYTVVFECENNAGSKVSLGWVNSCEIEVTTSEGEYFFDPPHMANIPRGKSTFDMNFDNIDGKIEKIVFTDLRLLSDSGLPDERLENVVIYDTENGVDYFEGKFSFFSSSGALVLLGVAIFVMVGVVVVIFAICNHIRNKKAMAQFNPYGGHAGQGFTSPVCADDQAMAMHMQAHQAATDAHNTMVSQHESFVNSTNAQQNNDFAMRSATTMDQGGFMPPPPPPPAGM